MNPADSIPTPSRPSATPAPTTPTPPPAAGRNGKVGLWLKRFITRRVRVLAAVIPAACLIFQLPLKWWLWDLAQHFHLYWMTALGLLALASCGFRWRARAAANAAVLLLLALPLRTYYWAEPDAPPPLPPSAAPAGVSVPASATAGEREIRFLSFNLLAVLRQEEDCRKALEAADPDMLLLLEFNTPWQQTLQPVLEKYPHRIGLPQKDSFGIWFGSKLPMEELRLAVAGDGPFPTVVGRVNLGGKSVGIVGAHPMNPVFPAWSATWREQFAVYPEFLKQAGGDAQLFAGDLNSSPFATTFQTFLEKTGLRDSARGRGLMNTWSGPHLPIGIGLPIDHILVSGSLRVLDLKRGPKLGSDHRWLEARLRLE